MLNPDKLIGYLLKSSGRAFTNEVNACVKAKGLGITIEQIGIVFRLSFLPGSTQKEIADFFNKDKTTVARVVGTMEKNDLLVRVPSETDKRINKLYLTNKGKEMENELSKTAMSISEKATDGISEKELETCKKVLRQIRENLEN